MADWSPDLDERAAIVEHDAGIPREWAEGFARLDADKPPVNMLPARWRQFVNDCGRFLDDGWASKAAALGWGPLELFGCDRSVPLKRFDRMGLLLLLNGRRLVALAADRAVIECGRDVRQTYCRTPDQFGRMLAWELLGCPS